MATDMTLRSGPLGPALADQRRDRTEGLLAAHTEFRPGLALHTDPAMQVSGRWRSPPGRLLELDLRMTDSGAWIGLHVALDAPELSDCGWVGFACRCAAPTETMIRPCLRSGTPDGFTDCFFDKHILAVPEPRNHVDALHPATSRHIPETAPWRELVLFLPRQDFRWHLHDLRLFLI